MRTETPDVIPGAPAASTAAPRRSAPLLERATTLSISHAAGALIAVGIVLRLVRFLHYRSLWLDEATLALNIMSRSYSQLVRSLDFAQGAPAGFLALEKLSISMFGDSERAFRLVPLLAGIASLFVFWRVAQRFLDPYAALLALAFFSFMECFVYYGAETRPYELDVLATLVLLLLFDRVLESRQASVASPPSRRPGSSPRGSLSARSSCSRVPAPRTCFATCNTTAGRRSSRRARPPPGWSASRSSTTSRAAP